MLLNLLYAAVAMILFILTITVGYALSGVPAEEPTPGLAAGFVPDYAPDGSYQLGKKVWNTNVCGACHNKNMKDDATGPALGGVTKRWADYPREDLYAWIRNSQALIASGHPRAVKVYKENDGAQMSGYLNLTAEEIEGLLTYIEVQYGD
jgi:cytochrome c2